MSDHVRVEPEWALPPDLQWVEDYLRTNIDRALRLRRSLDLPEFFVLERRATHTRPDYLGQRQYSDARLAARDGYVHVSHVHPALMTNVLEMVLRLRHDHNDLGVAGNNANQWWQRFRDEEQAREAQWEKDVQDTFEHQYAEGFDILDRLGDKDGHFEKYRINSAGHPDHVDPLPAGDPASNGGESHVSVAPTAQPHRESHDQS